MISNKVLGGAAGLLGLILGAGATVALLGGPLSDAQETANATQGSEGVTVSDTSFARDAAEGGMAEVRMGQLASDRGHSQAVKDFGKRMVNDHNAAGKELSAVAAREKVSLPGDLSKHDQALCDQLLKLNGAAFDRTYARWMVRDHEKDISEFDKEATSGKDESIKGFAQKTLPTLEEHLKMAREMLRTVSGTSASSSSGASGQAGLSR